MRKRKLIKKIPNEDPKSIADSRLSHAGIRLYHSLSREVRFAGNFMNVYNLMFIIYGDDMGQVNQMLSGWHFFFSSVEERIRNSKLVILDVISGEREKR